MLELIADLFRYQAWADAQIVAAVKAHAPAADDDYLRTLLHHVVAVQRFFTAQCAGEEFDRRAEMTAPATLDAVERLFAETRDHSQAVLASLDAALLPDLLERPLLAKLRPTMQTALLQTVLHSQHHRGQVAARLRALGGTPPTVDYILWKRDQA